MGLEKKGDFQYVVFENLKKTKLVSHCFTTRLGGVSKGVYESMNLSFTRGDQVEDVLQNFHILSDALALDYNGYVLTHQTHTTNIRHITQTQRGMGVTKTSDIKDTDGLVTNVKGIHLVCFGADCVPLLFLDTVKEVIGVAHAGWRGTVEGIGAKMVEEMKQYGCQPKDLLVAIGPSIGKCCFQVDDPVVSLFREKLPFAEEVIEIDPTETGKYKIDLWQTNAKILTEAGIPRENIEITDLCTMCRTDLFYSHRVTGNQRGNMAGVLSLL